MFWSEEENKDQFTAPDNVWDVTFKVSCKQIKLDHAWPLTQAISEMIPWLFDEPQAAIHHIYIPQSGNGWNRLDDFDDEIIQLSRRTRLKIRVPKHRLDDIGEISGKTISIDGHPLTLGESSPSLLSTMTTLVSRHVHIPDTESEQEFLNQAHMQIKALGINVRKMLCGKTHSLSTANGSIQTRSLMIADISPEESITLQENGIGEFYHYGCGVFIPQKGITAVNND